eukprot:gnl/Trimastix_PCT/2596.p1 GENE.gnl/Trimastix_PCT/2596~~gnl/Trimastix_PCT/2596.p1  ORF type:complete len:1355 (+),score=466.46 gnl/Trimastix_PCT/2596:60-4124(+)
MKELFVIPSKVHGRGVPVKFAWHPKDVYLASVGELNIVHIWNREGKSVMDVPLTTGQCMFLEWDKDGELLAIMQRGSTAILLWDSNSRSTTTLETSMKDLSFMCWSRVGPQLAIGTGKGNLIIYNKQTLRKQATLLGKHTKRITCGAWNAENRLALGSEEKKISINSEDGTMIDFLEVQHMPHNIHFSALKLDNRPSAYAEREPALSCDLGHKVIVLYEHDVTLTECSFLEHYGSIVDYRWFGDGYIMVGFSSGRFVVLSTHAQEIGQEVIGVMVFESELLGLAYSSVLQRVALLGDNMLKVYCMQTWQEFEQERHVFSARDGQPVSIQWTADGHIVTVATSTGALHCFLAKIPPMSACFEQRIGHLTSLREVTVTSLTQMEHPVRVGIDVEPAFISVGPLHVAVGMNNRAWIYRALGPDVGLVAERECVGTIDALRLSSHYFAVLCDGYILLNATEPDPETHDTRRFPEREEEHDVTDVALTRDFLIYSTQRGGLHYFSLADWTGVNEYRHTTGIRTVHPNVRGTRLIFQDDEMKSFLYNPVNDSTTPIDTCPPGCMIMWDQSDWAVFVAADLRSMELHIHVATPDLYGGPSITKIGTSRMPPGHTPILVSQGVLFFQRPTSELARILLDTHTHLRTETAEGQLLYKSFSQNLALGRLKDAWDVALLVKDRQCWQKLARAALDRFDITLAIRAYRQQNEPAMVIALERLESIDDKRILSGHIALLLGDYTAAQNYFLASPTSLAALDMRCDLMQWEQAILLAQILAPQRLPAISYEYAKQLEFNGDYPKAQQMYQAGLTGDSACTQDRSCQEGIARMRIRLGDIARGVALVMELDSKPLYKECALLLESISQLDEAASLYERAGMIDKAAEVYIQTRHFSHLETLLPRVRTPKIHLQYAKACESDGNYKDAIKSFKTAGDMDSVVRILLNHTRSPEKALALVRRTKSPEGALLVARFCQSRGNFKDAIEFLVAARRNQEAFELAQAHDEVEHYADIIEGQGTTEEYLQVARFLETNGEHSRAASLYAQCNQFHRAMKLFMQSGTDEDIHRAIDLVGRIHSEMLTNTLLDYLMGETDGCPKDLKFLFYLYVVLGDYPQATKTALSIVQQHQEMGNYKLAHDFLVRTHSQLQERGVDFPLEMARALRLLHSYVIAKKMSRLRQTKPAARMLVRVAKNISQFSGHIISILTFTVITCYKAGLRRSAFEYATLLMRPEYRHSIEAKFRKRIEDIVRRADKQEEDEGVAPCPYCGTLLPESQLECSVCQSNLPYCIVSGMHMVATDWAECPACRFPALHSQLQQYIAQDPHCPMCDAPLAPEQVVKTDAPMQPPRSVAAPGPPPPPPSPPPDDLAGAS